MRPRRSGPCRARAHSALRRSSVGGELRPGRRPAPVLLAQRPRRPEAESPQETPTAPQPPSHDWSRHRPRRKSADKPPGFTGSELQPSGSDPDQPRLRADPRPLRLGFPDWNRYDRPWRRRT